MVQLRLAIEAVFKSWMGKRAVDYRKEFNITRDMANGTAVNVCTMVFGNMGFDSATGVAFTRDPGTGENILYGEYLVNAQGEDVVAGIRTPKPIQEMKKEMPKTYREMERIRKILEEHFHEVQDFEFTVEKGTLYILQTRNGKMNAQAIVRTSKEMAAEKLINKKNCLQGHPGSRRDQTRGYSRILCFSGNLDESWRKNLPCRRGGKRYGETLCLRMGRASNRSKRERSY